MLKRKPKFKVNKYNGDYYSHLSCISYGKVDNIITFSNFHNKLASLFKEVYGNSLLDLIQPYTIPNVKAKKEKKKTF